MLSQEGDSDPKKQKTENGGHAEEEGEEEEDGEEEEGEEEDGEGEEEEGE